MTRERSVTKSVRLSPNESALLAEISAREHLAEGTLPRKWVLDALAQACLDGAIAAYMAGEANPAEPAGCVGVSAARRLSEFEARGIDAISPAHVPR